MPFTGACRRTNSQGRLRALRATASVEFGGFRAFLAGVKVASLRLQNGAVAREKHGGATRSSVLLGRSGPESSGGQPCELRRALVLRVPHDPAPPPNGGW